MSSFFSSPNGKFQKVLVRLPNLILQVFRVHLNLNATLFQVTNSFAVYSRIWIFYSYKHFGNASINNSL